MHKSSSTFILLLKNFSSGKYSLIYTMPFFIIPTSKWITITFPFGIYFIAFSFYSYLNSKLFLICFLQLFFSKRSNNFFIFKIASNIWPRNSIFNFCNNKSFFRPIKNIVFCKNVFVFWYSNNITNFKFRIFIINFFTWVNIYV